MRTWIPASDDPPEHARWIAVKSATTQRKFAREPHDIVKELQVLSSVTHGNVFLPSEPWSGLWADARMEVIDVLGCFHNRVDLGALNIYTSKGGGEGSPPASHFSIAYEV